MPVHAPGKIDPSRLSKDIRKELERLKAPRGAVSAFDAEAMKPETRMPNLGLSDEDAKAVVAYLSTLRAPKPDKAVEKVSN